MKVAVILPAAGLGTRMTKSQPEKNAPGRKQFLLLDGEPVLIHTIRKFSRSKLVNEIVVSLRGDDIAYVQELVDKAALPKPIRLVLGGDSRQQSVENALEIIDADTDLVAVHDAVRPFVDLDQIDAVIREAAECGAAILGIVPVDTVKQVHRNIIRATIPRDKLVLAQTPQVFRFALLKEAYSKAGGDCFAGTDEASLVERLEKVEVHVVAGSDRNIKITKPTDIELARFYLEQEKAAAKVPE